MNPLQAALQHHAHRLNHWPRAERTVEDVLKGEVSKQRDFTKEHGLSSEGTTLTLGKDGHQFVLSFRQLPSGNVRVAYTSPYVEQRPNEPTADVLVGVQDSATFINDDNVFKYLFEFYRRIAKDIDAEGDKVDPVPA